MTTLVYRVWQNVLLQGGPFDGELLDGSRADTIVFPIIPWSGKVWAPEDGPFEAFQFRLEHRYAFRGHDADGYVVYTYCGIREYA